MERRAPNSTERSLPTRKLSVFTLVIAIILLFEAKTTLTASVSQLARGGTSSDSLLFVSPGPPLCRAGARSQRAAVCKRRSPSAELATSTSAGGGMPLALRFGTGETQVALKTTRMASRGGKGGERVAEQSENDEHEADGGIEYTLGGDKGPRNADDSVRVSPEFTALCQAQFEVVSSLLNATRCALYFRREDPISGTLEFVPAAVYPEKQRVWVVGEGPSGLPSQGALQARLPLSITGQCATRSPKCGCTCTCLSARAIAVLFSSPHLFFVLYLVLNSTTNGGWVAASWFHRSVSAAAGVPDDAQRGGRQGTR